MGAVEKHRLAHASVENSKETENRKRKKNVFAI